MRTYKSIRKIGKRDKNIKQINLMFLVFLLLMSCCNNINTKETDGKNTLIHRLELIKKPICKLETYKDVIECLLKYNEAFKQSNRDKEEMIINY